VETSEIYHRLKAALAVETAESSDFDLNPSVAPPPNAKTRPAGVLVAFLETTNGVDVILTKRSSALKHHPGQIAFPGGKVDPGDADAVAAALREAQEEVGLMPGAVEVLGILSPHRTVTSFDVTPVLAWVTGAFTPRPEPGEVDEIFTVPFEHIANAKNFAVESRRWRGQRRHYYIVPYGPYYIWGATARILRGLAEKLAA